MRILFDQGTPIGIGQALTEHRVVTAAQEGWSTLLNGELLDAAEKAGFDVLLTTDTNLPHQQNITNRKLAVVVLSQNRWTMIRTCLPRIAAAIECAKPGTFSIVNIE